MYWIILKALLLLSTAWFVLRTLRVRDEPQGRSVRLVVGDVSLTVTALLSLILAGQAYWQLSAETHAGFNRVVRYDARPWKAAMLSKRREVEDRRGRPLIRNEEGPSGPVRVYPLGPAAAHLTGYHHRRYGKTGLEAACDRRLLAWHRNVWEELQPYLEHPHRPGRPQPLALTLDATLQRTAFEALADRPGAVVVLNPWSGDVLALVSTPSFDPNLLNEAYFQQLKRDPRGPFLNRALQGLYPPGSVFKLVTVVAALEQGFDPNTQYDCPAEGYLPPHASTPIRDYQVEVWAREGKVWPGQGRIDLPTALRRSANTYFAQLGVALGAAPILDCARQFGFETSLNSGLTLGGTAAFAVRPSRLPPSGFGAERDVALLAIGQGRVLATPLQMALVTAAIANEGRLMRPRLLLDEPVAEWKQPLSPKTARTLAEMMRGVVEQPDGTGQIVRLPDVSVAAKTGSAENPHGPPHAWFVCFAPAERPELVIAVVVENGGWGGPVAGPIARRILLAAKKAGYFGSQAP
ncbi:MAG TPA: penicillin-binding protein 2 [Armatimonadetes bacterium]|nr:penicillin-binding protein 2 [Armatimonadota bacterium]